MLQGILWAIGAGIMLGLYALPEKYIKGYKYENTWFLFFLIALIVLPLVAGFGLINNFGAILTSLPSDVLLTMVAASFLWGVGVQFWSKAINYIGMSIGFSIFIGAVILIGSIMPFIVDGLPSAAALKYIMAGLVVILIGIGANGRAGLLKMGSSENGTSKHMVRGILIALIGGLFATGFSLANAVGVKPITEAVVANGNPVWMSAIAVMCIIYWAGALYAIPYFVVQLCKNGTWSNFKNSFGRNVVMAFIMAFLNFAASAAFAYAAFSLGNAGNTIGYAIYNTASGLLAVVGGILTKEWVDAPAASRKMLYLALASMIAGVVLIAMGNGVA